MEGLIKQGRIFVLEGPDGIGKTTLASALSSYLQSAGLPNLLLSFPGQEPGTLGAHIYSLHHSPEDFGVQRMNPTSKQVLHIAAHIDTIENQIRPALKAGRLVVLDRYWWSTWVYGLTSKVPLDSLRTMIQLEQKHWSEISPEILYLIDRKTPFRSEVDPNIFSMLRAHYLDLAVRESSRHDSNIHIVPNNRSVNQVISDMITLIPSLATNRKPIT